MKNRHVIFASNDRGSGQLAVALYTLLKNSDPSCPLTVSILTGQEVFSAANRSLLESIAARFPHAQIGIIDITPTLEKYRAAFYNEKRGWPMIAWSRCFISEIFPEENGNIVWLDIDTYTAHDLKELYELDFGTGADGRPRMLAAVYEHDRADDPSFWDEGIMPEGATRYFNSGVLVINARAFREENALERIAAWNTLHRDIAQCIDQDALNALYWDRVIRLPMKYNYSDGWLARHVKFSRRAASWRANPPDEVLAAIADPYVLHFWGGKKPWRANHRAEGRRYEAAMREIGLLKGQLPGMTFFRRLERAVYDLYYAFLRRRVNG